MVARGEETLSAAADQVRAHGGETLAIAADVTIQEDIERLAATVHQHWGGTDIVCHAAGRSMRGNALDTPPDAFRELWDVNFLSAVRLCQAFAPQLTESLGHIVLVGSLASKVAPRYLGAYPASKFSIAALAQQLRLELADRGVHVLLVCPGPIARDSHAERYIAQSAALTAAAQQPGGGAKVSAIDPRKLTERILRRLRTARRGACGAGQSETPVCPIAVVATAGRLVVAEDDRWLACAVAWDDQTKSCQMRLQAIKQRPAQGRSMIHFGQRVARPDALGWAWFFRCLIRSHALRGLRACHPFWKTDRP